MGRHDPEAIYTLTRAPKMHMCSKMHTPAHRCVSVGVVTHTPTQTHLSTSVSALQTHRCSLMSTYFVPGAMLSSFHDLVHLTFMTTLLSRAGTVIIPILQVRKLRFREVKVSYPGHTAAGRQGQELNPGRLAPELEFQSQLCPLNCWVPPV